MDLFIIITLAISSSLAVGYFGVAFENFSKELENKHDRLISKVVSTLLFFPLLEKSVDFLDSLHSIPQDIQRIVANIKTAIVIFVAVIFIVVVFKIPAYIIFFIFGLIIFFIFKLRNE